MRRLIFSIFFLLLFGILFSVHTKTTCAYNIDTCAGFGADGITHTSADTVCYYSQDNSPYFTSDADHACKHPGCPDLPAGKTCDDMITTDSHYSGSGLHGVEVDTTVNGASGCPGTGGPYKCCAKVTALPTGVAGTGSNPCPDGTCDTALGGIDVNHPEKFIGSIFSILLSVAGVVALLLIITAGYQLALSQGNPEKVKAARERLTAAIVGLMFIIFSVAILQVIGVDILHLPGFSK